MRHYCILLIILALLLCACSRTVPQDSSGTEDTKETINEATEESTEATEATKDTTPPTGWITENNQTVYINEDGSRHTGWLELDNTRYYLNEQGILQTGWLELDGQTYYLKSNGSISRGKTVINDRTYYFSSTGAKVILANPWNFIPADYESDVVYIINEADGYMIDSSCRDELLQMLSDCRKAGYNAQVCSAFRYHSTQIRNYNNKVWYYIDLGYSEEEARKIAATIIAVPGTSEHELGLAVDLVDNSYWVLDEAQENTPAQKWLMANCWNYGFILRYPNNKSEITGIIYEPWHYRYVGKELAKELQESGLCLEEYLNSLS